jgi:hypothetical protein
MTHHLPTPFSNVLLQEYKYIPSRTLLKELVVMHWDTHKPFYFWHMWNIGAETCSGDMTFKRAKFIVTKQNKPYAPQWKGLWSGLGWARFF